MITDSLFGNAVKKEPEKMGGNVLPVEDGKPVFTVMDLGKMLLLSAKEGNTPQVRELMTKGAPFSTDWLGTSPLHLAAMNNHLDTCEVLIRAGLNKDARTKVDRTPLHFAVYEGHEQIVELLVGNQCDIDARDMLRMTPLHWAVEKRHRRIVEILLRHGADPSAESKFRKTATSMALEHGYNEIYLMLDAAFRVRMENPDQFRPPPLTAAPQSEMKANGRTATVVQESIELGNTPSPPINSSSIDEDNGMTLSDAIIRLQTIDETRSVNPSTTLQMLKDHGISMLPTEDTENAFISSALQGGRKLVLSEAGKLMMNETRAKRSTSQQHIATSTPRMSLSPASVKPLKPPNSKVIKIVTAEEFKRMLSGDLSATKKVQLRANGAVQPAKQRRQMVVSRRPELLPAATDIFAESDSCRVKPNQVPNLLDIHAEEPLDTDPDDYTPELGVYATPAQVECSVEVKSNLPTSMGLSEIEKQLLDLKKQTEELRRQLEISQRQNEEYKVRLEKLEQEKELERRQKSHINS